MYCTVLSQQCSSPLPLAACSPDERSASRPWQLRTGYAGWAGRAEVAGSCLVFF